MRVAGLTLRDFRCYEQAEVALAEGLTVIPGPNGAGKTNLLEALYFGCTGRSCRTTNEREVVRFGAGTTRVVVRPGTRTAPHELAVGFTPGEPKRMRSTAPPWSACSMLPAARSSACSSPTAWSWSRAPRRCAALTWISSSPRCGRPRGHAPRLCPGARPAQRAADPDPRPARRPRRRWRAGTCSWRATGSR